MIRIVAVACLALTFGCATKIFADKKDKKDDIYIPEGGCNVREFETATELPDGAKNLGWVGVLDTGDDEQTTLALRQKICQLGGDAFSSLAWVRDPAADKHELKANAWSLP